MEGDGIGLDGRLYHLARIGTPGWVTASGKRTAPGPSGWTPGWPYWRFGGWRNDAGAVTFPLEDGGWSNGKGARFVKARNVLFEHGLSKPLRAWRSVAVDPRVIPLGSRVFVPAYCSRIGHAWFRAQDTGGAITGRHVDVYRTSPAEKGGDTSAGDQRVYVVPPGTQPPPGGKPTCAGPSRSRS
jgi:3D (Asp-Asp-Asp) domain-containing protein